MFVNREKELQLLEESYRMFLEGHSKGVLVYGFRKVGKTRLIEEFLKKKLGIIIDLSAARTITLLKRIFIERLSQFDEKIELTLSGEPLEDLRNILLLPQKIAYKIRKKMIIALDEFHVMIEKVSSKIARKLGMKKEKVISDILWIIRNVINSSPDVFWIFISSIGWEKLQEYISRKYGGALVGILDLLRVDPLSLRDSIKLAKALVKNNTEIAEEIARISGGIPRIIEILARRYNTTYEKISLLAINAIHDGDFDEVFDNMIRAVAEISRRDYDILIQALKAVAESNKTTDDVAKALGTSRDLAYAVLEELHRLGLLEKKKMKKRVFYQIKYPLLGEWLRLRIEPKKPWSTLLVSALGITAESYMRELLAEAINKTIIIYDDARGTFLYGTADKFILNIIKVYSKKETERIFKPIKNADIIAEAKDSSLLVFEVKTKVKEIMPMEIDQLVKAVNFLRSKGKNAYGILVLLGPATVSPATIARATKENIIILSKDAVKLLAKKLKFPHW